MSDELRIIRLAKKARRKRTHAPYSNFPVGAALKVSDCILTAGNAEMKPSVISIHAEQMAAAKALARGYKTADEVAIALSADQPPCGLCLQALSSINPEMDMRVHTYNTETESKSTTTLEELIPHAYTPDVRHETDEL